MGMFKGSQKSLSLTEVFKGGPASPGRSRLKLLWEAVGLIAKLFITCENRCAQSGKNNQGLEPLGTWQK